MKFVREKNAGLVSLILKHINKVILLKLLKSLNLNKIIAIIIVIQIIIMQMLITISERIKLKDFLNALIFIINWKKKN